MNLQCYKICHCVLLFIVTWLMLCIASGCMQIASCAAQQSTCHAVARPEPWCSPVGNSGVNWHRVPCVTEVLVPLLTSLGIHFYMQHAKASNMQKRFANFVYSIICAWVSAASPSLGLNISKMHSCTQHLWCAAAHKRMQCQHGT